MTSQIKIAIIGATGLVGRTMVQLLQQRMPETELALYASANSSGSVEIDGVRHTVHTLSERAISSTKVDIALLAATSAVSKQYARLLVRRGAYVIDNSSYWRMDDSVPLIVPEVNAHTLTRSSRLIANPNCSTIQAVVALAPLMQYGINRIVYSTYQSVSGAGYAGVRALQDINAPSPFAHTIQHNVIPTIDTLARDGYTKEEHKMINETRKILSDQIAVTGTTVRVPVMYGHCVSINAQLQASVTLDGVLDALRGAKGVCLYEGASIPTPLTVAGSDDVHVGRVRLDASVTGGVNMWVVADNVRKGAATNAVQIAQAIIYEKFI